MLNKQKYRICSLHIDHNENVAKKERDIFNKCSSIVTLFMRHSIPHLYPNLRLLPPTHSCLLTTYQSQVNFDTSSNWSTSPHTSSRRQYTSGEVNNCRPDISRRYESRSREKLNGTEENLTVGLLEAGAGTTSAELLRLAATRVRDDEGLVVGGQGILDLLLGGLINVLLVEGDESAGDSLTDSVDLGNVTSTLNTDLEVQRSPLSRLAFLSLSEEQQGLVDLDAHDLRGEGVDGHTVDTELSLARLDEGDSDGS